MVSSWHQGQAVLYLNEEKMKFNHIVKYATGLDKQNFSA